MWILRATPYVSVANSLHTFQTNLVWTCESVHTGDSNGHWTHVDPILLGDFVNT